MDIKTLKAHLEASEAERAAMPWYKRIPLNIWDFVWYRIIRRIEDIPSETKWWVQRKTKGYSDCDVWGLNSFIINTIRPPLKEFVKYQEEQGKSLPVEFSTDPAAWLNILKEIEYAFDSVWREENDFDNRFERNMTDEQRVEHNKRVQKGFEYFGKYAMDLWD